MYEPKFHTEERLMAWSSLRMIAETVGELFGPVADLESEEASLHRGPEYPHFAQGIVEALQRVEARTKAPPLDIEFIARRLFPDDVHNGIDCKAEIGREGEPCRVCADSAARWANRIEAVRVALSDEKAHSNGWNVA